MSGCGAGWRGYMPIIGCDGGGGEGEGEECKLRRGNGWTFVNNNGEWGGDWEGESPLVESIIDFSRSCTLTMLLLELVWVGLMI